MRMTGEHWLYTYDIKDTEVKGVFKGSFHKLCMFLDIQDVCDYAYVKEISESEFNDFDAKKDGDG